jgi:hypothetical protein
MSKIISIIVSILGTTITLLGLLWFLQGTGIIYLPPILCVANCEPITEPSLIWAISGAIALILGVLLVRTGVKPKNS